MAAGCPRDHRPKFGNLFVNTALLRLETFDGGGDDIRSQRVRHSIQLSISNVTYFWLTPNDSQRLCGSSNGLALS